MSATEQIDACVASLDGWRRPLVARLRTLVHEAIPEVEEAWKWETPVFARGGTNVVAIGIFKDHVRLNFFRGASLADPAGLFNAGLEAKASRGIDIREGEAIDEPALADLMHRAASA